MKDEALKLALEALRSAAAELYRASSYCNTYEVLGNTNDAITAIQQARSAQPAPVQEPVGYVAENGVVDWNVCAPPILTDLYTTPPAAQRQWVGLTRAECLQIEKDMRKYYDYQHECKTVCLPEFAKAIEAILKEKNT